MRKISRKFLVFLTVFSMLFNNLAIAGYAEETTETATEQITEAVAELAAKETKAT